jgi:uncharacterized protein
MKIYWHEISENPSIYDYTEKDSWINNTITAVEEEHVETKSVSKQNFRISVYKVQNLVFMKGSFNLTVGCTCSRCAKGFIKNLDGDFENIFTREKSMENSNFSNHGTAYSDAGQDNLNETEILYVEKDYIELEDVLKEQIYLALPLQPLCKEDCKGICAICGQDQNLEPCQCYRIKDSVMAQALKAFKGKF